jgi:Fic-DOC domain mobile mystery protein B
MFGDVWKWAGRYRTHDTNIGAHWPHIQTQVRDLLADVVAQTADPDRLPWSADEVAIRFHHRLGVIRPFPNGNGRHARLVADLLVAALGRPVFTWGSGDLSEEGESRQAYLKALRRADASEDFEPLVRFARS